MAFGINKRNLKFIFNPILLYHEIKRKKLQKKYSNVSLVLGNKVSIVNAKIGKHVYLGNNVFLNNSEIGDHSYLNSASHANYTKIGKFCSIGSNVKFGLGYHPTNLISTHPAFYSNNKDFKTFSDKNYFKEYPRIILGNDVWVGINVIVMGGVTIGDGAIIAAGAIVTKDVESYAVVGGVPARHLKYRIDKNLIRKVIGTEWWNKDEKWFKENHNLFRNQEAFMKHFKI